MLAVFDSFEHRLQLADQSLAAPAPEQLDDTVSTQSQQSKFATPVEQFLYRMVSLEHKVPAVLNLMCT
jgi:hypothetical protein